MASSLPQVGLEAVIAGLPGFESGAKAINSAYDSIEKKAGNVEKATHSMGGAFSSISSSMGNLAGSFVNLGQGVLQFGAIAGGAALVGVTALTAGIIALGTTAFSEFSKYERMSMSITNLTAREISQGTVVEQQIQTRVSLTAKETEELNKLKEGMDNNINRRDVLIASIQEQEERIRQLTAQYGENGLVVIKERAELDGMRLKLSDINGEIDTHNARIQELINKNGQMVTTLQKVRTGQMSMSDAMAQATPRAQELLKWIQLLAIQSPFSSEGVAQAFKTALSYGFTTKEAQRLTEAMIDFTAATGAGEEVARGISLALGQMRARGKLSAEELNQLSERGVGVNAILERMGYSLGDVTKGMVDVDQFIEAVIQDMEIFGGSAKQQSSSFAGLTASLGDLKAIGLREFFTGTFKAIQPYTAAFTGWLTEITLGTTTVRDLGDALGTYVASALKTISEYVTLLTNLGAGAGLTIMVKLFGPEGIALWKQVSTLMSNVSLTFIQWGSALSTLLPNFSEMGGSIIPSITSALTFLNENFEIFKGVLLGIGAVMGAGVFAALVAGLVAAIMSILTPINLIIAAGALLGAAWAGNWYGIRDTVLPIIDSVISGINKLSEAFQIGGLSQVVAVVSANLMLLGNTIKTSVMVWGTQLWDWIIDSLPIAQANFALMVNTIKTNLMMAWPNIQATLLSWATTFWDWTLQAAQLAGTALMLLGAAIFTWASSGETQSQMASIGQSIGTGIVNGIKALFTSGDEGGAISAINNLMLGMTAAVAGILGSLIILGGEIVAGITSGILQALGINLQPATFAQLSLILTGIGSNIVTIARYVGTQMINGIMMGWNSSVAFVTESIQGAVEEWQKMFDPAAWFELGTNIIEGLLEGINKAKGKVLEVLKDLAMEAVHDAMNVLGISSPSTVFRGIGQNIIQGLTAGVTSESQEFTNAMMGILSPSSILRDVGMARGQRRDLSNLISQLAPQFMGDISAGAFNFGAAVQTGIDSIGSSVTMPQVLDAMQRFGFTVEGVTSQVNAAYEETNKLIRLQNAIQAVGTANQFAQMGQTAADRMMTKINDRIEVLKDWIADESRPEWFRVSVQEELNQKLLEQKNIQEDINSLQKQQADLTFLQQQLSMVQMIKESGLNVKDVLGGITLGLNASLPDMVAAMNNVVQAMIGQIDADLQIQSPSRVMIDKFKLVGQGMAMGLLSSIPAIQNTMSQIGQAIIDVPMGQASPSSVSNTNNYNFDMTVNSGATPQAVIQQYQVMRAMVS